jgi:hypothetical protein
MRNQQDTIITAPVWDAYRVLRLAVILLGPVVTLAFAGRIGTGVETASIETAVMLLWSPLFFSIPALMLQNERDAALPLERNFLVRGIKLLPYLLSKQSPVRAESIVSTVMWLWLLLLTGNSVLDVVARTAISLLG